MNVQLARQLEDARALLAERPDGHLPLPVRRRIRNGWGFDPEGQQRRFALDRLVAARVLPRWQAARPDDDRPQRLLELAGAVARREADPDDTLLRADRFDQDALAMLGREIDEPTLNAAAAAAAAAALAGCPEEPEQLEDPRDDEDLDADDWDPDFLASMVDAPSLPKMGVAEHVEPRRAFWRWYLDEAVPAVDRSLDPVL